MFSSCRKDEEYHSSRLAIVGQKTMNLPLSHDSRGLLFYHVEKPFNELNPSFNCLNFSVTFTYKVKL